MTAMPRSPWQQRIHRAQDALAQYAFSSEILKFYMNIAGFQEDLHRRLGSVFQSPEGLGNGRLGDTELYELGRHFDSFLRLSETDGPDALASLSRKLRVRGDGYWHDLLQNAWEVSSPSDAQGFLAWAFLQPYAELRRSRASGPPSDSARALCRFCNRRPAVALLRPLGEGSARSLVCCFCLAEWEFRRIRCPACGEENDRKLPVFTGPDFDYIRLGCCDTCKTYIKTIDLTRNGHADPIVDDLASTPLDLWARDRGYARLQPNFLGL